MKTERQSNFELLRIVSIVLIVAMHAWGYAFASSYVPNQVAVLGVNAVGNTGVTLFVLISGWFGLRFSVPKLLRLVVVVWVYSVLTYAAELAFMQRELTAAGVQAAVLPLLSRKYWFMTCYVVLLCLSPWLNLWPERLARRELRALLGVGLLFFVVAPTLLGTEIMNDGGKGLANFILVYLCGRYLRLYGAPVQLARRPWWVAAACCAVVWAAGLVVLATSGVATTRFARDNDLFIFLGAVAIFMGVARWQPGVRRWLNAAAGYAFPLYLVNGTVVALLAPWLRQHVDSPLFCLVALVVTAAAIAAAVALESLRRLLLDPPLERLARTLDHRLRHA